MIKKVFNYLKATTWCQKWLKAEAEELYKTNEGLLALANETAETNRALLTSLTASHKNAENEQYQKLLFMGAIALQSGGMVSVPIEFIEMVQQGNYLVTTTHSEDDKVVFVKASPIDDDTQVPAIEDHDEFICSE